MRTTSASCAFRCDAGARSLPPIEPAHGTLWQNVAGQWKAVPVWTCFTDNRETALVLGPGIDEQAEFVVEIHKSESSQSTFQKAIMLSRPENRKL